MSIFDEKIEFFSEKKMKKGQKFNSWGILWAIKKLKIVKKVVKNIKKKEKKINNFLVFY